MFKPGLRVQVAGGMWGSVVEMRQGLRRWDYGGHACLRMVTVGGGYQRWMGIEGEALFFPHTQTVFTAFTDATFEPELLNPNSSELP